MAKAKAGTKAKRGGEAPAGQRLLESAEHPAASAPERPADSASPPAPTKPSRRPIWPSQFAPDALRESGDGTAINVREFLKRQFIETRIRSSREDATLAQDGGEWNEADARAKAETAWREREEGFYSKAQLVELIRSSLRAVWMLDDELRFPEWDADHEPLPIFAELSVVTEPNSAQDTRALYSPGALDRLFFNAIIDQPAVVAQWLTPLIFGGTAAVASTVIDLMDRDSVAELETNTLSWVGNRLSYHVRRKMLLDSLLARGWNLAKTAEGLRMGSTSHVLRAMRDLDLMGEYEAAKEKGIPRRGGRAPKKKPGSE